MRPIIASLKSGWTRANAENAPLLAAGIAYYAFLSFVPLLGAIVLAYGLIADPETIAGHAAALTEELPASSADLVTSQLESVTDRRSGTSGLGFVVALALALFGSRLAAGAVITAFDVAFRAREKRGLIRANLLALAVTLGAIVAFGIVAGATAVVSVFLAESGERFLTFALVGLVGVGGAVLAYRLVPNSEGRVSYAAALRGAVLFAIGWMGASAGFGFYVSNFGNYNATYGSLGAVVVFLTWLFISALLLLIGAFVARASAGGDAGAPTDP
ncbi:YihY/virulence factor BrkB family protein [Erythrobacter sp. HL-111]|uniref:YihY/virulence factor BrkB family protein n=1 Tax=Erythrobacter sp. HL-111 TaxID=1798193 RepID=UPI0006D94E28|nr:YihY/virulence factor BrkB family protein [Erythrobacter sp. HL-111]KPP90628.1 MAG: membrane protein [Erythrobacteraceae bacterium HL-111]